MEKSIAALGLGALLFATFASAADVTFRSETDKQIYVLGMSVARNIAPFNLSEAEVQVFEAGLNDGLRKRTPKVDVEVYGPKIQELAKARTLAAADAEKQSGEEFLKKAEAEKGAVKTASGLIYLEIRHGTGATPGSDSTVKVNYEGRLRDGTVFDSSYQRKSPIVFPLNQVIACWKEGVQKMQVGGKAKLVCPASIAYGDRGAPPVIKPGSTLVFEVELLEVVKP